MQLVELPKTRLDKWPHLTGSELFGTQVIWEWDQSDLVASSSNFRLPGGRWSGGGPFYTRHQGTNHVGEAVLPLEVAGSPLGPYHICGVIPGTTSPPPTIQPTPSYNDVTDPLVGFGATGYRKTRPGNPIGGLFQFVVELRDLPKQTVPGYKFATATGYQGAFLKGSLRLRPGQALKTLATDLNAVARTFKALGSEYLNVVFGWKPFVNDLRKLYLLWKEIDKRMGQIIRQNGKVNRYHATLKDETSTVVNDEESYPYPFALCYGAPPNFFGSDGHSAYKVVTTTKDHVWYMAASRYYIPDVSSSQWTTRAKAVLFGGLPTPDTVWQVLPWAWLADWFSNVGDVISNISPNAVDNLVVLHSYTMRRLETSVTATSTVQLNPSAPGAIFSYPGLGQTFSSTNYLVDKIRLPGSNPFGFGPDSQGITPGRMAILAALGLSRGIPPLR